MRLDAAFSISQTYYNGVSRLRASHRQILAIKRKEMKEIE